MLRFCAGADRHLPMSTHRRSMGFNSSFSVKRPYGQHICVLKIGNLALSDPGCALFLRSIPFSILILTHLYRYSYRCMRMVGSRSLRCDHLRMSADIEGCLIEAFTNGATIQGSEWWTWRNGELQRQKKVHGELKRWMVKASSVQRYLTL